MGEADAIYRWLAVYGLRRGGDAAKRNQLTQAVFEKAEAIRLRIRGEYND